ncbi:MAG: sugar phosphorylase [Pseudomonadota bacterium]
MESQDSRKYPTQLAARLCSHLERIYPSHDIKKLCQDVQTAYWGNGIEPRRRARMPGNSLWSEKDNTLITYGNSIIDGAHTPLDLLDDFLLTCLDGVISGVHILPFFPYTSDDGFAVTDYYQVNSSLGSWSHISRIADNFTLMSDLVINHMSSQGEWFSQYRQDKAPGNRFFFEANIEDDISQVVRPRAHPLLRKVETVNGTRHVWCTFSHDQVDFDFSNPDVLLEFLKIMRFHINKGVRTIRLDAVAFMWKQIGTRCIHLPQTHEIVRLMRTLADYSDEKIILITETNVPNAENLSYFGNRNEAHAIYNFSLPPLIVHALLFGTSQYLNAWQMAMPPAQLGCAYFNFVASHDGIGMRPAEGLLPDQEISQMIDLLENHGGRLSKRAVNGGGEKVYEVNIALFDAFQGTQDGLDTLQKERFLCSQSVMMALEGIPGFYIHSLLATSNDYAFLEKTGHNRSINRHQWDYTKLNMLLNDPKSVQNQILLELKRRIKIRSQQAAFHPNATQFTLQLGTKLFGFWRQSLDRSQSIFAIANVTHETVTLPLINLNLIEGDQWIDLLSSDSIASKTSDLEFAPYQCRWISNQL